MKIAPSILAANLIDLKQTLEEMDRSLIDFIHLDVMDGHFVPALTFGELFSGFVKEVTDIPLDVHLMVARPELEIPKYFNLRPHNITFHIEATNFPVRLIEIIKAEGIKAGIALNPGTAMQTLEPIIDYIDLILIMSVEPGFYGQKFIENAYNKLDILRGMEYPKEIIVEVDGGVGKQNIDKLQKKGVDICVAGSAIFKSGDINQNVRELKKIAQA